MIKYIEKFEVPGVGNSGDWGHGKFFILLTNWA